MTLVEKIKADRMTAIKKGENRKEILTLLLGDIETQQKKGVDITDEFVVRLVKKLIESNKEVLKYQDSVKLEQENYILQEYLPQQMSEHDIEREMLLEVIFRGKVDIGFLMKFMKEKFAGKYDGKLAKEVAEKVVRDNE